MLNMDNSELARVTSSGNATSALIKIHSDT